MNREKQIGQGVIVKAVSKVADTASFYIIMAKRWPLLFQVDFNIILM